MQLLPHRCRSRILLPIICPLFNPHRTQFKSIRRKIIKSRLNSPKSIRTNQFGSHS